MKNPSIPLLLVSATIFALTWMLWAVPISSAGGDDKCSCVNIAACLPKDELPPQDGEEPPPDKPPIKPEELVVKPTQYLPADNGIPKPPEEDYLNDSEFPEFDHGSGTAKDTPDNIETGRRHQGEGNFFPEQRRFIRSRLLYARNSNLSAENMAKFNQLTRTALTHLNEMEREKYKPQAAANLQKRIDDVKTNVDEKNAADTESAKRAIRGIDASKPLSGQLAGIYQVISNNLGQERTLQLFGQSDGKGGQRFREILEELVKKVSADCGKSQFTSTEVRGLERTAQMYAVGTPAQQAALKDCAQEKAEDDCKKLDPNTTEGRAQERKRQLLGINPDCTKLRVVKAVATFAGIQYEATKCSDLKEPKTALVGDWKIKITGVLAGTGNAKVGSELTGNWAGHATVDVARIRMYGPVEFVSNPGACQMKLTSAMGIGEAGGLMASAAGVSGLLPVAVTNEECGK